MHNKIELQKQILIKDVNFKMIDNYRLRSEKYVYIFNKVKKKKKHAMQMLKAYCQIT